jgi:hypothetical protein
MLMISAKAVMAETRGSRRGCRMAGQLRIGLDERHDFGLDPGDLALDLAELLGVLTPEDGEGSGYLPCSSPPPGS